MKTVQECLRELDMEELLDSYLTIPFIRNEMIEVMKKKETATGKEIWNMFRNKITEYIEYMRNTPIEPLETWLPASGILSEGKLLNHK